MNQKQNPTLYAHSEPGLGGRAPMSDKPALSVVASPEPRLEIEVDLADLPPRVPDADYLAHLVYHETAFAFTAPKVYLWFKLIEFGEHFEKMLYRPYGAKSLKGKPGRNGRFTLVKGSDLLKMILRVLQQGPKRPDRVSLSDLKNRILRVRTRTIKTDYRQRALPEVFAPGEI